MVKIAAPDQDSNRAGLARGERTGDSCFSFQQAAVYSQSQYYLLPGASSRGIFKASDEHGKQKFVFGTREESLFNQ